MRDARINYFFFGVNITEQAEKQKAFLSMSFGGPHAYTGRDMHRSHAKLISMGMNDRHFDLVVEHLKGTLVELGVDLGLIEEVLTIAESTREDVMGRRAAPPENAVSTKTSERGARHSEEWHRRAGTSPATHRQAHTTVGAIMEARFDSLTPEHSIQDAADVFVRGRHSVLPVLDQEGRLLGLLSAIETLRHLSK
jgi:hemoglobin